MTKPSDMTDEDLEAAVREVSKRRAAAEKAAHAERLAELKGLTDVGFGSEPVQELIDALAEMMPKLPRQPEDLFVFASAAHTGLVNLNQAIVRLQIPVQEITPPPTVAAP